MFDKILLNPPYSKNLHLKILQEAMKHSDDVVNLSPIRWLQDPLAEYKKNSDWKKFESVRKRIETLEPLDADKTNAMFGIQMGQLGIYYIKKDAKGYTREKDSVIEKILKFEDRVSDHVSAERTSDNFCQVLEFYGGKPITGTGWVKHPDYVTKSSSTATDESTIVKGVSFKTRDEAINFYESFKRNVFVYLWVKAVDNGRFFCGKYFPFMPTYTHPWTDEMLYEYFNLTPEEIAEIEQEIK